MPLNKIKGLTIEKKNYPKGNDETLLLLLENDQSSQDVAMLRTGETRELKRMIEKRMEEIRMIVKVLPSIH